MKAIATVAVAGALMLIGLGACGSGGDVDARMAGCLKDAGHDASVENVDKRRVEQPEFSRAYEGCAAKVGVPVLPAGEEIRRIDERMRNGIRCMQQAGWEMPEPQRAGHGALVWEGMDALTPPDRRDAFWADHTKCVGGSHGDGHDHTH